MAANSGGSISGGVEWSQVIKPLVSSVTVQGKSWQKQELTELVQALAKSDAEFQKYDPIYENFYTPLAALSAHHIVANASFLGPAQANTIRDALKVIIRHLLLKVSEQIATTPEGPSSNSFTVKQLLVPLTLLCGVEDGASCRSDITVLTMFLKEAKVPPTINNVPDSKTGQMSTSQSTERRRTDGLAEILTGPLRINPTGIYNSNITMINTATPAVNTGSATSNTSTATVIATATIPANNGAAKPADGSNGEAQEQTSETQPEGSSQATLDAKKLVTDTSISLLGPMRAGATLLSLCGALPCLQRYLQRLRQAKEAGTCQYQHHSADATLVGFLVKEVTICQIVMSLPCLEPLTASRITLLTDIAAAWLLCASSQASVHLKDEDGFEVLTAQLVEGALGLFNTIGDILKTSTRAGGYVYQNHQMLGTWVLLSGLHQTLSGAQPSTPQPSSKSPARPNRPYNTRQMMGVQVTWVALGFRCLEGIRSLLADARLESQASTPIDPDAPAVYGQLDIEEEPNTPATLNVLTPHTATQRAARIAACAPMHQLLIFFAIVCFRKATALKRAVVQKQHEQDADHSDSTAYYQDMIMCSEDSETEEEDSEPLLGLWFEATLVAPDGVESNTSGANAIDGAETRSTSQSGLVPDKAEPYSYISLATEIFVVLDSEILCADEAHTQRLGSSCILPDTQVNLLVALVRDIDRETARTDTGTISPCFGSRLGRLYNEFSNALVRYLHSLTSSSQVGHIAHVLLDPYTTTTPSTPAGSTPLEPGAMVPLQVGCRIVKVMASLILAKRTLEREACILSIWAKTVNTLTECALQPQPSPDHEYEDMNVEFAQLLVYLFHSLNLMQKKSVLITTANAIIKVAETLKMGDRKPASQVAPHQLMLMTRLLLLLEYIMKHLYDAPPSLLAQIEWNLIIAPGLAAAGSTISPQLGPEHATRMYCSVGHVEQAYRKRISQDADVSMRPKFYALTSTEINNQETPKLDGLACNFVLGTPDKLKYPQLLSALLSLLNCATLCDHHPPLAVQALCAAHYCFQTAWRLIITMPPSTPHMMDVSAGTGFPLHSLIWAPRAAHQKTFSPWLKDTLVKQGMYTQYAENLLSTVTTTCDNIPHTMWLATNTFKQLKDNISSDTELPSLIDVMTVNCVLLRLRFLLEVENAKQQQSQQQATSTSSAATTTTTISTTTSSTASSGGGATTNSSSSSSPSPPPSTGEVAQTPVTGSQSMQEFVGQLLDILETVLRCCRICVTRDFTPSGEEGVAFAANVGGPVVLEGVMRCCGSRAAPWLRGHLPPPAKAALDKAAAGPPFTKPISTFSNDAIPCESGILHVVSKHCQLMSSGSSSAPLLLLAMETIDTLSCQVQALSQSPLRDRAVSLLLPACVDGRLEYLQDHASGILNQIVSSGQKVEQAIHQEVLSSMYPCMVGDLSSCNDKILKGMVKYWEKVLERPAGRQALEELFGDGKLCLGEILISAPSARQPYSSRVVRFFNKIFQWCNSSSPVEVCISVMSKMGSACSTPSPSSAQPGTSPSPWLAGACLASPPTQKDQDASPALKNGQDNQQSESCSWSGGASDSKESVALALFSETSNSNENALLLENLTRHMIQHCDESASMSLLSALISLAPEALRAEHAGLPLPRLLREAARLADAHTGCGHRELLPAALKWLNTCVESLQESSALDDLDQVPGDSQVKAHLEAACHLLAYISDCLHACFGPPSAPGGTDIPGIPPGQLPSWDAPTDVTPEADWADDPQDEDDTSADDSDEDSMLHLKLCTFTTTAREYMNQHWYHCHTCKMVDRVGVCTVCALVCHRNHDVTYAKYGNFFCDCGAKDDSSCQALVKRSSSHSTSLSKRGGEIQDPQPPPSMLRRRPSSPAHRDSTPPHHRRPAYASNINGIEPWVWESPEWLNCLVPLQNLLGILSGPVSKSCERHSAIGRHARARQGLTQLHAGDVKFQITDMLMVPTLGSQEGAFENVRMSYTGEQGQAIRHLIVAHVVRRVAMCCMALPNGKRQHLAVSHEKGKITILQLSQLLKQADSSKRKLTLTRLTSASIPFPVLSLSASPYNEDVLAVTGYRDCHILTFTGGPIYQRLVMQPGLDPGNFIIRSIWLPGNQTQLALVTADFVKIYDLSKDATLPEYHFLVPSGKVRDVTFVSVESGTFMLCMGSAGHIYWQAMNEVSHAANGPFYITNTVDVIHNDIKDVNGQVGGGGVSIYYSHTLKMLFFSYAQGKSFMAPLTSVEETLQGVTLIQLNQSGSGNTTAGSGGGSGGSGKGSGSKGAQALCQWQEVPGHPGLVTAVLQASNNPIVMMLAPNSLMLQEIKVVPAKAKITDMVAVRHCAAGESKTTLILLCEDGSLRIYAASPELTGYWLSPSVSPTHSPLSTPPALAAAPTSGKTGTTVISNKRFRNPSLSKSKNSQASGKPGGSLTFPVDFFEHCVALNDVEFGGNDLLQVYHVAQIKHRLATNGLYVASTKLGGFTMEITNTDSNTVITGIRVLLGNQDIARTSTYIEVCGRTIQTNVTRSRWYDVPLTREESLQIDRKLTVIYGPSQDPDGVCMVDSVKVYGRNKEAFGWPEDNEEGGVCATGSKLPQESGGQSSSWTPPGVERLACGLLETLELSLGALAGQQWWGTGPKVTATTLLCAPCPLPLQMRCKALLHALLGPQYHQHKDQAILSHVMEQLHEMYTMEDPHNADPENFCRLVILARGVAAVRPQNLVKYAGTLPNPPASPNEWNKTWTSVSAPTHLAPLLIGVLSKLSAVPSPLCPPCLAPVDRSGLRHHDHVLHALADVIHTLMVHANDQTMIDMGNRIYLSLLLSEDQLISFGAKSAIVRVLRPRVKRRRVYIPSPPATPGASSNSQVARSESPLGAASSVGSTAHSGSTGGATVGDPNHNQARQYMDVDQVVDMSRLLGADAEGLEALLDIPPDADDEAMVEFAIVLSLQEGRGGGQGVPGAPALPRGGSGAPSDATASATGSDEEEGDGEVEGEGEGEVEGATGSGGTEVSPVGRSSESGSATSGRSSAYGETTARTNIEGGEVSQWSVDAAGGADTSAKVRSLRLALLDLMVEELPHLRGLPGIRTIPFMQVLLMLASAMEYGVESEQVALERCLSFLVSELSSNGDSSPSDSSKTPPLVHCRTSRRELQLLIMRLLSVLMARWKPTSGSTPGPSSSRPPSEWHTARAAALALRSAGVISQCEDILGELLPHWKEQQNNVPVTTAPPGSGVTVTRSATTAASNGTAPGEAAQNEAVSGQAGQMQLLRPQPPHPLPDMQPFFLRQYVKSHAWDVLENYPNLLTEMSLRLPYQVQQHCEPPVPPFSTSWHSLLCQYMMNQQTPFLRKQVRKLLLMMCGTKEKYRQLRDVHALNVHLEGVHKIVEELDFSYDSMVTLMDHLKACVEIVTARTGNWQHMCTVHSPNTLSYLVGAACLLGRGEGEGVAPTILQLLQGALCNNTSTTTAAPTAASNNDRAERGRSAESDASVTVSSKFQEQMVPQLVQQILNQVTMEQLRHFIRVFLLETNSTSVRWQAHALMVAIYENCTTNDQTRLVKLMWELWPALPQYGRKTAQFVDLLGYFSLKTAHVPMEDCLKSAVNLLKAQNQVLTQHGNAPIYSALSNYVELEGYYLESEPCLVCNNPETPMATIKLSTVRVDSKFTTQTQIVKLAGSHTISRIGLRIGDLKRTKMVRTINVFYNNRTVQAVQELKNKPGMWHKAKTVVLISGQTDVRIDFPLPIVACNLMMEYADFYENTQASGESLQCPRCSAAVPANPGVCANCGENVFQCHKCRAINYDEKDPFLCHACGFCKYAKFDYTLTARPCCAVERIENDEDRKRMVVSIGLLLDKADRVYRQLVANKPLIESLLHKISEHRVDVGRGPGEEGTGVSGAGGTGAGTGSSTSSGAQVNRVIQYVAHKYCVDSKNHFDDLSKIIQRVLTCRRELIAYDKSQSDQLKTEAKPAYTTLLQQETAKAVENPEAGHCYGCALAAASHCLTLLRALASLPEHRQRLCQLGLVTELVHHNLRRGTPQSQEEVRQLICVVTRDNLPATRELCNLLSQRITLGLLGHAAAQDHTNAVRPLVLLLGGLVKIQDSSECWEVRLRCVIRLWVWCCPYLSTSLGINADEASGGLSPPPQIPGQSPQDAHALQQVALPCLQYLHHLMQPPTNKDGTKENLDQQPEAPPLDLAAWLAGRVSYADWKRRRATPMPTRETELDSLSARDEKLALKYTNRWKAKAFRTGGPLVLSLGDGGWLKPVMFNPSSKMARDVACQMIKSLCTSYERTKVVLLLLTQFLPEICTAGEASEQFLQLFQSLASEAPWKQFLALHGVLSMLADLLTKEIDHLHVLEETTLTSDLAQGYALKRLTELMAMFLEEPGVRRAYKGRLMGAVLGGYLSLRRLVVQRTRLIDDTQEKLLELLEEMTTGTETETAEFMAVCIETVKKYPLHDFRTPVFIFERLCSIIYPEENDVGEFFLSLEKDPQQEDFLQGRMLGNPYSSLEPGLGPLMRDVKNKICTDCELVALLEDDNGMELLVNNKIMSLDLPVKEVYKKVWCVSGEGDAMRVVYRMRGLLGDATEEFVETLSTSNTEAVDDEQVYKMANVLAYCGGIEVMLERLAVAGGGGGAARPLARTLLRLLSLCVRARSCVRVLTQHTTQALPALLQALNMTLNDERNLPRPELTCNLLEIMDRILSVAAGESMESFLQFSLTFGGPEYVQTLLNCTQCPGIRNNQEALQHLTRVLAALVYGNELKMAHLCQHFKQVLDFNKFDAEHRAEDEFRLELFCVLCSGIERNAIGGTLKDYLISLGIVRDALDYITMHAPCVKPTLLRTDSDELKEFISKPALKYILRFLTGLATDHEPTQMAVCEKVIPIVHRLEQVSSDEHVGSLAENLLEALMSEPQAAKRVRDARDYTRQEKKRLAMAMREKQLGALGMRTNDKGQVTAQCSLTHQVQELGEETGVICCICREGYKYQPTKVLGIYTFTKRFAVEEFEVKARKTLCYTTVTHFNVVHVECHMAAVRLARSRDEWESAALQNASTKCNGLLPLWGPHVPESAFASCLARHNTYLQECTGHHDINYQCTVHDLKLLLLRFARERPFHEDTGGGGPLSNMQLVPSLVHMALYVINTTRIGHRLTATLQAYLEWSWERQLESSHEAEGPLYYLLMALLLQPPNKWRETRLEHLRRIIVMSQVRSISPSVQISSLQGDQTEPRPYEEYKPYLMYFSLIQLLYDEMFKHVPTTPADQWPVKLAESIRHSDETVLRCSERILSTLSEQLLPCQSFEEWLDAAGLLGDVSNPQTMLKDTLEHTTA